MAKNDPAHIVAGAGLLTAIFTKLNAEVMAFGGTAEDIHRLSKPEGDGTIRKMAELVVAYKGPEALLHRLPIETLEFSLRTFNVLRRLQLLTVGDLVSKSEPELLRYAGMTPKDIENIKDVLAGERLRLKED